MHDAADCVPLPFNQQMHMIIHQAVGIEQEGQLTFLNLEELQKLLIVFGSFENCAPIISARDQMIKAALNVKSRLSRHGARILMPSDENSQWRIAEPQA